MHITKEAMIIGGKKTAAAALVVAGAWSLQHVIEVDTQGPYFNPISMLKEEAAAEDYALGTSSSQDASKTQLINCTRTPSAQYTIYRCENARNHQILDGQFLTESDETQLSGLDSFTHQNEAPLFIASGVALAAGYTLLVSRKRPN